VTWFGPVVIRRLAYRAPGAANLHPGDAALNLPARQAGALRLSQRVLVRRAVGHLGQDDVGGGIEHSRSATGTVPARPSVRALSTGVPDMTVDSARNAAP
jgi:hypothetical protein